MADLKVIEGGASKARIKAGPVLRAAVMLFVLVHLGRLLFGGLWLAFAEARLEAVLASVQVVKIAAVVNVIGALIGTPLALALLGVVAPLFGWWVYSRIPAEKQTSTGWGVAGLFVLFDLVLSLGGVIVSGAQMYAVDWIAFAFAVLVMEAIIALWIFFFMGCGFLIARLFKSKL